MIAETHRHAGHMDIVREDIDEQVGLMVSYDNLPPDLNWARYHAQVQGIADRFRSS